MLGIAKKENLLSVSQARCVTDYDVYFHPSLLQKAKSELEEFIREAPKDLHESVEVVEDLEAIRVNDLHRLCLKRIISVPTGLAIIFISTRVCC